jgi:hypothetical protein
VNRGKPGAYHVAANFLIHRGEELLAGPLFQLEQFAAVLNAAKPRDPDIAPTLRALIAMTRDCSFAPGERLLGDGTPLRLTTPQKPKRDAAS